MKTKKVAMVVTILIVIALVVSTLMEYLSTSETKNPDNHIVFEYDGNKIYENDIAPYMTYYSKLNGDSTTESKNTAIDNYIRSSLFDTFASDLGIKIEDIEVSDYIKTSPIFKEGDKFSQSKYDAFINSIGIRKNIFENEVRKDLAIIKLMKQLENESGIKNYYFDIINETLAQNRTIQKVRIDLSSIPVSYTPQELADKYEQTKANYKKMDNIEFTKYTYIHPDNQATEQSIKDMVAMETEKFYSEISGLKGQLFLERLKNMNLKNSKMSLTSSDFAKLTGANDIVKNTVKIEFQKDYNYVDKSAIENGVVTVYHIDGIKSNGLMSLEDASPFVEKELANDLRLDKASADFFKYNGDLKASEGQYFKDYKEELINPLKNDQTESFYKTVYSLPINGISLISDKGQYYFIKLVKIDKTILTEDQLKYFRTSQENIYKQFVLMSTYDSLKDIYKFKKYKKES